ncbi:MAG TPA: MarR family transcriptional regulator [Mucilaginibacter sp.]|jgi:DNA-binding MarR family transcriptional regulator
MNKTVELVNQWADFEEKHPDGDLDEFCRYQLTAKREKESVNDLFNGEIPRRADIVITKLIDRLARIHMIYVQIALKDMQISHFEEFSLLSAIANLKTPRKTEVIYHTINELSTGLNLLAGMNKQGYITEEDDPDDKRSKRLRLTPKGEKVLQECYERFSKIPEILFMDIPEEDVRLCTQLLKNVEIKFAKLWLQHKSKTFDEVYERITRKEP